MANTFNPFITTPTTTGNVGSSSLGASNTTGYTPSYGTNSPFANIINEIGKNLHVQNPFTEANPYESYAAPYREMANQYVENTIKPWFNQYQLNPFQTQQANAAAAGGARMMGTAPLNFQNALNQLWSNEFYQPAQQINSTLEQMVRDMYNQEALNYANNPNLYLNP